MTQTMRYYVAIALKRKEKQNEERYKLMWNNFQDTLFNEKETYKTIYKYTTLQKYVCIYFYIRPFT